MDRESEARQKEKHDPKVRESRRRLHERAGARNEAEPATKSERSGARSTLLTISVAHAQARRRRSGSWRANRSERGRARQRRHGCAQGECGDEGHLSVVSRVGEEDV